MTRSRSTDTTLVRVDGLRRAGLVLAVAGSGPGVVVAFDRTGDDPHLADLAEQLICALDT